MDILAETLENDIGKRALTTRWLTHVNGHSERQLNKQSQGSGKKRIRSQKMKHVLLTKSDEMEILTLRICETAALLFVLYGNSCREKPSSNF